MSILLSIIVLVILFVVIVVILLSVITTGMIVVLSTRASSFFSWLDSKVIVASTIKSSVSALSWTRLIKCFCMHWRSIVIMHLIVSTLVSSSTITSVSSWVSHSVATTSGRSSLTWIFIINDISQVLFKFISIFLILYFFLIVLS